MSQRFAIVTADSSDPLKLFYGATGVLINEYSPPSQLTSNSGSNCRVSMSYDGNVVAIYSTIGYSKIWFINLATNAETTVDFDGIVSSSGFDGAGSFYISGQQSYLKIDPPYVQAQTFTLDRTVILVTCQDPHNAMASLRDPNTGQGGYFQFDLTTGAIGADVGIPTAYQIDTQSKHVFGSLASSGYGARQWNYSTGDLEAQVGPEVGDGAGSSRTIGFTSDGLHYVMKTGPNTMGYGTLGDGTTIVPMDSVLPISGDNSTMIFEGLLDDTTALLSHAASPRSLLVAFDVITGQVKWSNNSGNNQADPSFGQESARAGVQPILGPSGPPPEPAGFWKENVLAYETV